MEALQISGGRPLSGSVEISGAKNGVLPILAATVIRGGTYLLHNCPNITDVAQAAAIIETLGGSVSRLGSSLWVDTTGVDRWIIPAHLMAKMRASVLFLGPLLARFGRAVLTMPGGCPLGRRPIDLHLEAMARMGASVCLVEQAVHCEAPRLHGCFYDLPVPSVGATENAVLAAVACHGTVVLQGAAQEPEIGDLLRFLQTMGAELRVSGSTITIHGGAPLTDAAHTILPDRIETATYLCAAAGCGGDLLLQNTDPALLMPVLTALEAAGCTMDTTGTTIRLRSNGSLQAIGDIETAPYPGFPTDAQAVLMAALLRAKGQTRFVESIFERRFGHTAQLQRFGADIDTTGPTALVRGTQTLHGASVCAGDLRAAAALVIAALQIGEKSLVFGLKHLDRGYDSMVERLQALGAEIQRSPCNNSTGNFSDYGV